MTSVSHWAPNDVGRLHDVPGPAYDGAPRGITRREAILIARDEYVPWQGERGWYVTSRGADGGYHLRGEKMPRGEVTLACEKACAAFVQRIMAGECRYVIFYDRARDRFYAA